MKKKSLVRISRTMSYILRHGALQEGIEITPESWVLIEDLLTYLKINRELLDEVVEQDGKQRYEVSGDLIRASQGHSMVVTPESMEATWTPVESHYTLYHGTHVDALPGIAEQGILAMRRTHVHLSDSLTSAVGKRANAKVFLCVSPQKLRDLGLKVYSSSNGVILTRYVPVSCIDKVLVLFEAPIEIEPIQKLYPGILVSLVV